MRILYRLTRILFSCLFTVVAVCACHHAEDNGHQPQQPLPQTPQDDVAPVIDTTEPYYQTDDSLMTLQHDTARRTESGIFRKNEEEVYSFRQICGHWVNGTLHECYYPDSTGRQWDTSDDVSENEAQTFRWSFENNHLKIVYRMSIGGAVPRDYTVTFVDDETLVYKDFFETAYMWDKVE